MGLMDNQMNLFARGGLKDEGGEIDKESGNRVPVGGTKKGVRDDIPANVSEGEFVFPEDVVRYIGLEKLMTIRQKAKMGLQKMEDMGQMGNGDEATIPDDMPFEMADLVVVGGGGEPMEFANGGFVPARNFDGGGLANHRHPHQNNDFVTADMVAQYDQEGNAIVNADGSPVFGTSTGNGTPNGTGSTVVVTRPNPATEQPAAQNRRRIPKVTDYAAYMNSVQVVAREYRNEAGESVSITFINGIPTIPIPVGYTSYTANPNEEPSPAAEVAKIVNDRSGEDEFDKIPTQTIDYNSMTPEQFTARMKYESGAAYKVQKGFGVAIASLIPLGGPLLYGSLRQHTRRMETTMEGLIKNAPTQALKNEYRETLKTFLEENGVKGAAEATALGKALDGYLVTTGFTVAQGKAGGAAASQTIKNGTLKNPVTTSLRPELRPETITSPVDSSIPSFVPESFIGGYDVAGMGLDKPTTAQTDAVIDPEAIVQPEVPESPTLNAFGREPLNLDKSLPAQYPKDLNLRSAMDDSGQVSDDYDVKPAATTAQEMYGVGGEMRGGYNPAEITSTPQVTPDTNAFQTGMNNVSGMYKDLRQGDAREDMNDRENTFQVTPQENMSSVPKRSTLGGGDPEIYTGTNNVKPRGAYTPELGGGDPALTQTQQALGSTYDAVPEGLGSSAPKTGIGPLDQRRRGVLPVTIPGPEKFAGEKGKKYDPFGNEIDPDLPDTTFDEARQIEPVKKPTVVSRKRKIAQDNASIVSIQDSALKLQAPRNQRKIKAAISDAKKSGFTGSTIGGIAIGKISGQNGSSEGVLQNRETGKVIKLKDLNAGYGKEPGGEGGKTVFMDADGQRFVKNTFGKKSSVNSKGEIGDDYTGPGITKGKSKSTTPAKPTAKQVVKEGKRYNKNEDGESYSKPADPEGNTGGFTSLKDMFDGGGPGESRAEEIAREGGDGSYSMYKGGLLSKNSKKPLTRKPSPAKISNTKKKRGLATR